MLTRKCQETLGLLLRDDDFNCRVTIAYYTETEGAWKEHLRDSLGQILLSENKYNFKVFTEQDGNVSWMRYFTKGKNIIGETWDDIKLCNGVRIEIVSRKGTRSWVIVKA